MTWAKILYICLMAYGLVVNMLRHGEPQPCYHGGKSLVGFLIAVSLLGAGGFFD